MIDQTESLTSLDKPRRPWRKIIGLLLFLLVGTFYTATNPESLPQPIRQQLQQALETVAEIVTEDQPGLYSVTKVVDGDTIEINTVSGLDVVRLIGIDTPETQDPRKPVQCYGQAAKTRLEELLAGQKVRLEADPADSDRDKYRRLLRYVYLPDGTFVNLELVRQGYAFAYTIFPNAHLEEFRAAEAEARAANRGLWADCEVDQSKAVKQTQSQ